VSRTTVLLLLLAGLAGCEHFVPDVGDPLVARCIDEDSDPDVDISFERDVRLAILTEQDRCVPCHDPNGANNLGFEIGGLDMTSYESLIAGGANSGANIVVAGSPCDSIIIKKLSAGPPFGSRMPFNGPPFVAASTVQIISDWIVEGARNN
jgi:hypothetical protein